MDFFNRVGKVALGSRLRRLSEQMTDQASSIYELYEVDLHPRWYPVFFSLMDGQERSITDIAREIGHSHPSVCQITRELSAKGYITEKKSDQDGRKNFIQLTPAGHAVADRFRVQIKDVDAAVETAMKETRYDLWEAINEWEFLLEQKNLFQRVKDEMKRREAGGIEIVSFEPRFAEAFRQLNVDWISHYFTMEAADYKSLDHPQEYILDKGGYIAIALYNGEPVGSCALIRMDDHKFELAKMAVSPKVQGKGIGKLLGQHCIQRARELGADTLYLESNSKLAPAINLYYKLGFQKVPGTPSPYKRANVHMELKL